ncbi:MAG: trypsin-like serine protease [Myxococcota bacterium]
MAGCDASPHEPQLRAERLVDTRTPPDDDAEASGPSVVPDDWFGHALGIDPPKAEFTRTVDFGHSPPEMPRETVDGEKPGLAPAGDDPMDDDLEGVAEWVEITAEGEMFTHRLPRRDAALLYNAMVDAGMTAASGYDPAENGDEHELPEPLSLLDAVAATPSESLRKPAPPDSPGAQHTWSNGTDSRTRRAVADGYPTWTWPFRTIGHFATFAPVGGCTGTIIGRRTIVTSAHCVWGSGGVIQQTFNARADPSNPAPYGSAVTTNYIMPSGWFSESNCGTSTASSACFKHDIAVVRLSQPIGDGTGQMGFGAFPKNQTEGFSTYMRGYPACQPGAPWPPAVPAGCTNGALYGQSASCGAAQFKNSGCRGDGWYCTFDVKCDGSAGQSGSAVYAYNTSLGSGPVALGVYSKSECMAGGCGSNGWPNGITRITPDIASMLAYWKSVWG